jgi:HK97 gp10 family phage protein
MSRGKFVDNSAKVMAMFDRMIPDRLATAGEVVRATAYSLARVDTGLMRNSIFVKPAGWSVSIISPVEYSIYNELGTVKMAAQPFMFPALHTNVKKIKDIILSGSRRGVGIKKTVKTGERFRQNVTRVNTKFKPRPTG